MPVSPAQIRHALQAKRDALAQFDQTMIVDLQKYRKAWRHFAQVAAADAHQGLPKVNTTGAQLLEAFDQVKQGIIPGQRNWSNREESMTWVRSQLSGVTTFAVDGSQIFPSKDISLPVALVQIGWFENCHTDDGCYAKDIALDILTPEDLKSKRSNEPVDRLVNIRRFQMETQRLIAYMQACDSPATTLTFFDGSLVVTFADAFDPESQQAYVQAMVDLLAASAQYQVPLVGYIDTSYARDIAILLQQFDPELRPVESIHDAQILRPLMGWGDRTPLLRCSREGILDKYGDQQDQIIFTYLQTTRDRPPTRIELPYWLWEAGLAETVINWVRAEVIIGGGYPYAIETADQTAVLQAPDRQLFYRILQEWAKRESLNVQFSRKLVSKIRRR